MYGAVLFALALLILSGWLLPAGWAVVRWHRRKTWRWAAGIALIWLVLAAALVWFSTKFDFDRPADDDRPAAGAR